jgi:hypothetical protein
VAGGGQVVPHFVKGKREKAKAKAKGKRQKAKGKREEVKCVFDSA